MELYVHDEAGEGMGEIHIVELNEVAYIVYLIARSHRLWKCFPGKEKPE